MRKIAIWSLAGGVGKSTSAVNIAAAMMKLGKKVLLVDADPQCSATIASNFYMIWKRDNPPVNTFDLIKNTIWGDHVPSDELLREAIIKSKTGQYDVITCTPLMKWYHDEWCQYYAFENLLLKALEPVKDYDFVIIDCPTGFIGISKMCLAYADELYVPVSTDFYGINAYMDLEALITNVPFAPPVTAVFLTMMNRSTLSRNVVSVSSQELSNVLLNSKIRYSEALRVAPEYAQDVISWNSKSYGAIDYLALADEINKLKFALKRRMRT